MIFSLLKTFIANNLPLFLSLTRYTSPNEPVPRSLMGRKFLGPGLKSSSVQLALFELFEAEETELWLGPRAPVSERTFFSAFIWES
jgi:hypothetical protein